MEIKRVYFLLNELCETQGHIGATSYYLKQDTIQLVVDDTVTFSFILCYLTLFASFVVLMNCLTHL